MVIVIQSYFDTSWFNTYLKLICYKLLQYNQDQVNHVKKSTLNRKYVKIQNLVNKYKMGYFFAFTFANQFFSEST